MIRVYLPVGMWVFKLALPLSPASPEQGGQVFCTVGLVCSARSPLLIWGNRFPPVCLGAALHAQPATSQWYFLLKAFLMADSSHLPGGQEQPRVTDDRRAHLPSGWGWWQELRAGSNWEKVWKGGEVCFLQDRCSVVSVVAEPAAISLPALWPFQLCFPRTWEPFWRRQRKWSGPLYQRSGNTNKTLDQKTKQTCKIWSARGSWICWYQVQHTCCIKCPAEVLESMQSPGGFRGLFFCTVAAAGEELLGRQRQASLCCDGAAHKGQRAKIEMWLVFVSVFRQQRDPEATYSFWFFFVKVAMKQHVWIMVSSSLWDSSSPCHHCIFQENESPALCCHCNQAKVVRSVGALPRG